MHRQMTELPSRVNTAPEKTNLTLRLLGRGDEGAAHQFVRRAVEKIGGPGAQRNRHGQRESHDAGDPRQRTAVRRSRAEQYETGRENQEVADQREEDRDTGQ